MAERLEIDTRKFEVAVGRKKVHATRKEFDILLALKEANGDVLSREAILSKVWGPKPRRDSRTVDQHIARLRHKIGRDFIRTVSTRGYSFLG